MTHYQGNSGKMVRIHDRKGDVEKKDLYLQKQTSVKKEKRDNVTAATKEKPDQFLYSISRRLTSGELFSSLESEDIILFLLLYLIYRESGDLEALIVLAAMILL